MLESFILRRDSIMRFSRLIPKSRQARLIIRQHLKPEEKLCYTPIPKPPQKCPYL